MRSHELLERFRDFDRSQRCSWFRFANQLFEHIRANVNGTLPANQAWKSINQCPFQLAKHDRVFCEVVVIGLCNLCAFERA
jgi:hypothetical protein